MSEQNKNGLEPGEKLSVESILEHIKEYETDSGKDMPAQESQNVSEDSPVDLPDLKSDLLPFEPIGQKELKEPEKKLPRVKKEKTVKFKKRDSKKKREEHVRDRTSGEKITSKKKDFKLEIDLEKLALSDMASEPADIEETIKKTVDEHIYETQEELRIRDINPQPEQATDRTIVMTLDSKKKNTTEKKPEIIRAVLDGQIMMSDFTALEDEKEDEEPEAQTNYVEIENELKRSREKKISGFVLYGDEEEEEAAESEDEEIIIDDYESYEDTVPIKMELSDQKFKVRIKFMLTSLIAVGFIYLMLINFFKLNLPRDFLSSKNPVMFLILNLSLLFLAILINCGFIFSSMGALIRGRPDGDSALALAALAATVQNLVMFAFSEHIRDGRLHIYSPFIAFALLANLAGKHAMISRIKRNFAYVSRRECKNAVVSADDEFINNYIKKDYFIPYISASYNTKTKFLSNYIDNSFQSDSCDGFSKRSAVITFIASILIIAATCIFCADDISPIAAAVTAFSAVCCFCLPVGAVIAMNFPLNKACKTLSKSWVMLTGISAVESFSDTNIVVADAHEVFGRGSVVLNEYLMFGGKRLDEAILDTAAVAIMAGGPLSDVFKTVIEDRTDILPKVESIVYEKDMGVTGWVESRRVLVGNRILLENHGVTPPSMDYEKKYTHDGKKAVYLSVSGEINAMFVVSYMPDPLLAPQLKKIEKNNMLLFVRTCDANVTSELISNVYGIDEEHIRILSAPSGRAFDDRHSEVNESLDSGIAYNGGLDNFFKGLFYSVFLKKLSTALYVMLVVSFVINLLLSGFFSVTSGLSQISADKLIFFQLFWLIVTILLPCFKRKL